MVNKLEELSKEISYVLCHAPWKYEPEMEDKLQNRYTKHN